jgi:tight adherence protein C
MSPASLVGLGSDVAFAAAIASIGPALFAPVPAAPELVGRRGERRRRALRDSRLFAALEPLLLRAAQISHLLLVPGVRGALSARLERAGFWLGLTPDELVALSIMGGVLGALAGALAGASFDVAPALVVAGACLGASVPSLRLRNEERRRSRGMERGLPAILDVLVLCMGAGLDFPAALRFAVDGPKTRDVASDELAFVLLELELGHTRREALLELERRVRCDALRTLVAAIVQGEERGNPLAGVLRVQATVLRCRRGVLAEEAASRAGVLMIAPLVLLLGCILLLLLGPFAVGGAFR